MGHAASGIKGTSAQTKNQQRCSTPFYHWWSQQGHQTQRNRSRREIRLRRTKKTAATTPSKPKKAISSSKRGWNNPLKITPRSRSWELPKRQRKQANQSRKAAPKLEIEMVFFMEMQNHEEHNLQFFIIQNCRYYKKSSCFALPKLSKSEYQVRLFAIFMVDIVETSNGNIYGRRSLVYAKPWFRHPP